jgi:lipid-A-disaccharide synthase
MRSPAFYFARNLGAYDFAIIIPMKEQLELMIVAGEASGDAHAAALVKALGELSPKTDLTFFGSAGPKMREAGVEAVIKADDLAIVGIPEIARALPMFWQTFRKLKDAAIQRKPDAVILVDFPDFNLRLARSLKKAGLKVIYYISPQLWAWRKYRAQIIRNHVDLLLTILPFEKDWYAEIGIDHVEYVGNPLAGEVRANLGKEEFCRSYDLDATKPIVALLPGSRHKELARILPVLLEATALIGRRVKDCQFVVALAGNRSESEVKQIAVKLERGGVKLPEENIRVARNQTLNALAAADAAIVTSGTATLETAIVGTPMAIVYKTSSFNFKTLRPLIDVPHFGLINLIAGERVARELIQDELTPAELCDEVVELLKPESNREMREKLRQVVDTLGDGGASKRAAEAVLEFLREN